ncbi:MAG: helix-turn-helix transcriptional regulator [Bdellovibrionaceae bacterium]|nr:helix-turn-helix transcriptional regulator [Pseudobdellovibrionaceae bacterium]
MKPNDISLITLSTRIRDERKSQGLSQTELADLAGVSLNFVSQLESAKSTVRIDKVLQVLSTLGLELHIRYGKMGISQ